ncbi:MAG: MOSC domain-containing protein [Nannocystaceae bacterium]
MRRASIVQVNVNPAGGVPKRPVASARLTAEGVVGDRQLDLEHHGGPRRAVCLFSRERIDALAAEGHPIAPGTTGENLTLEGVDWAALTPGARLRVGDALLEITSPAPPCSTIAASFTDGAFKRISEKLHPSWSRLYAKVLVEGEVRPGDPVVLEPRA